MGFKYYDIQMADHVTRRSIIGAGGTCYVAQAGSPRKQAIYDPDNAFAVLSNPIALSRGRARFAVPDTVDTVDLYVMAPGGHFMVAAGEHAGGLKEIYVDVNQSHQLARIPFSIEDTAANTETDTGFDLPLYGAVLPHGPGILVTTLDSGMTIDVGVLSSGTGGDADGFIDGISLTTAGLVMASTALSGSPAIIAAGTLGLLLAVIAAGSDADDRGAAIHRAHALTGSNTRRVTYTLSSSTDTARGVIQLPYVIPAA